MKDIGKIFKIASTYTAVVLGAGFASGQELLSFFIKYGAAGFFGIAVSGLLLFATAYFVMYICLKQNIDDYNALLIYLLGDSFSIVIEAVVVFSFFVFSSTMLSAGGAALNQAFGVSKVFGIYIFAALCFLTLLKGVEGIVGTNAFLAPLMVISSVFIGLYAFFCGNGSIFSYRPQVQLQSVLASALLYASFNVITAVSVLAAMKEVVVNRKTALGGSLLGGMLISVIAVSISLPLLTNYDAVKNFEIPMLRIASERGVFLSYLYLLTLISAMFTTAAANFFSLSKWLETKTGRSPLVYAFVILLSAIFANFGFSNFVRIAYPIFGVIGLVQMAAVARAYALCRKKPNKSITARYAEKIGNSGL